MNYWLMKSEPEVFGITDLKLRGTDAWDGVRNYQARNFMKDMKKGDLAFFYHSNCKPPGIAGLMEVVREAYPDHTARDQGSPYFDPRSSPKNPIWSMVDVKFVCAFSQLITLETLREQGEALNDLLLLRKGNRLSVMPVDKKAAEHIMHGLAGYKTT